MDAKLQELFNQNAAQKAAGHPVGVGTRPMKWGDSNNIGFGAPGATLENCYVDIGPFPTPVPIRLDAQVVPKGTALPGIPARATVRMAYKLVYSIGESSQTIELPFLPRQLCVRSLQVYARRVSSPGLVTDSPAQNMGIWATPVSSNGAWPCPIDVEEVTMQIGTQQSPLAAPPRLATHVTAWAQPIGNLQIYICFSLTAGGAPQYRVPVFAQVSNNPSYFAPVPIPSDVETALNSWSLLRGATTTVETIAAVWCR